MWCVTSGGCARERLKALLHSSYNRVNQTHACSNAYTQNKILKGEVGLSIRCLLLISDHHTRMQLNFQGGIMSDWVRSALLYVP